MTVNDTPIATVVTDAAPAASVEPAVGRDVVSSASVEQVVQIDPHAVRIEDNVRAEARLSRRFVTSVKSHGVLVPVLAYADADGTVVVRDGQRRVLAAREAGLSTIPAYVLDRKDETRMRIIEQMIANEHREALSTGERAAAWRQLSLEGMSATAIARQTGAKRKEVEAGLVVAGHDVAAAAVADYDLTLDQAAVLVELEDVPDALAELREVAKRNPAMFDHYAQRALDAKATRDEIARLRAEHEAQGYTVVDWPTYGNTDTLFLRELLTPDGERLTEENYAGKPGHAVAIGERWGEVAVDHVVVDWREHGLQRLGSTGTVTGGKLTDEQKAERREVVANNKAWASVLLTAPPEALGRGPRRRWMQWTRYGGRCSTGAGSFPGLGRFAPVRRCRCPSWSSMSTARRSSRYRRSCGI
ncbi:ParB/RepB/Spo0J family partition protein [Jiangella muralis]|uniref:ParB/RepB/Spo0J family partition protein n=1 Tax=Jiangella muralis TaxID=702383 RepID=UPI0009FA63C8|nr:ParB N-terminal domain-containing protein [Jiangella muralis]